jgi:adenine-specific DNA-methyltransferase
MSLQATATGQWDELLDGVESKRKRVSGSIPAGTKADLGQFLTPIDVARFMAGMFRHDRDEVRLLDPGAGIGCLTAAFVAAAVCGPRPTKAIHVTLFEVDPKLAGELKETMEACKWLCSESSISFQYEIFTEDFIHHTASALALPMLRSLAGDYDCAILNPPYKKLNSETPTRKILSAAGIEVNNLYSAFLALAARVLRHDGELVGITPRSFCNGPYFKAFRYDFFSQMSLRAIHVYESRSDAFRDDEVLQENIIFYAIKTHTQFSQIKISTSLGPHDPEARVRCVPHDEVIHPGDRERVVHVVTNDAAQSAATAVRQLRCGLHDLMLSVSTGRVVDFRATPFLRNVLDRSTVPLIYPFNLENGRVVWPKAHAKKPTAIVACDRTRELLIPSEYYVVVKRFSAKEERKRIVAAVYNPGHIGHRVVGFENHLNYFHIDGRGLPVTLARGLAAYLNSTVADSYFRNFNGHTQVNAQDLRSLKYPAREQLLALGKRVGENVCDETLIDELLRQLGDQAASV